MLRRIRPILVLTFTLIAIATQVTFALIEGGEGNEPIRDPGWPARAGIVFNQPTRIAYWVGPPFGGGQWHGEYRGDAKDLNTMLAQFAQIDAKTKRLVLHDGIGRSHWLNPNRELAKVAIAQIDWTFTVWEPANWQRLRKLPPKFRPRDMGDDKAGPPTQIDVYTGGNIRWADVVVPNGIEVIDQRLEAHGFKPEDGTVMEGTITDLETKKPIAGRVEVQLIDQTKGGYDYKVIGQANADDKGHWVLRNAPIGWVRIVLFADGYVPRVVGYADHNGEPGWHQFNGSLLPPATVSGRVTDDAGKPLADVDVQLNQFASRGEDYATTDESRKCKTDAEGRFHFDEVPKSTASLSVHKPGYVRPGLGPTITTPAKDISLTMTRSAQLHVTVDFAGAKRDATYMVELEPEGGNVVGSWGGSSTVNEESKVSFTGAPPGRYFVRGHPNPHRPEQVAGPVVVELKGGATEEVKLTAKIEKQPKPKVKRPKSKTNASNSAATPK